MLSRIQPNQLGVFDRRAKNEPVLALQFAKLAFEKSVQLARGIQSHPSPRELLHPSIVLFLRMRVSVATARMPTNITVKIWADVPQLMEDCCHFLLEGELHESRHIKTEDVEHLPLVFIVQPLGRVAVTIADRLP